MISTLAPLVIRLSISAACFSADPDASALTYFSPAFSSAALIAASSVFQRSSWKLDHDTPTVSPAACAASVAIRPPVATRTAAKILLYFMPISSFGLRPPKWLNDRLIVPGRHLRDATRREANDAGDIRVMSLS